MRKLRSSVIIAGAIIARFKEVSFSYPGGCDIGARPIDLHLKGFEKLSKQDKKEVFSLLKLLKDAAAVLAPAGFDIEIVERHHNQKVDSPSGTAIALADSINEAMDNAYEYIYDRSQVRKKRDKMEIGISAVRGGTIVGDHEVIFAGTDEVIEFKHTAHSKAVFAKGAVEAAKFLKGKGAGLYGMSDVIQF